MVEKIAIARPKKINAKGSAGLYRPQLSTEIEPRQNFFELLLLGRNILNLRPFAINFWIDMLENWFRQQQMKY